MSDLLIVLALLGPAVLPALALAYLPRPRAASAPPDHYRGTPVDWPAPRLRLHPRFDRLPR